MIRKEGRARVSNHLMVSVLLYEDTVQTSTQIVNHLF